MFYVTQIRNPIRGDDCYMAEYSKQISTCALAACACLPLRLGSAEVEQGSRLALPCRAAALRGIGKAGAMPYFRLRTASFYRSVWVNLQRQKAVQWAPGYARSRLCAAAGSSAGPPGPQQGARGRPGPRPSAGDRPAHPASARDAPSHRAQSRPSRGRHFSARADLPAQVEKRRIHNSSGINRA